VEPHEYDDLLRRLTALVVKLDERDEHILALIEEQREFNRQQVALNEQQRAINADVRTTLARIEALIARMLPTSENGREA
jgi:seryl-tRNA synthetase